jgi:transposase
VIAPSLIPKRAGDRVKTDRRDGLRLAELSRGGELRAIWIPDPADEAIRDLARAREDAVNARSQVRQQLKGFLLRHEVRYAGKTSWSKSYYRWLAKLNFGLPGAQTAFTEYWQAVSTADERVARLTEALAKSIEGWRFEPVVAALQALRGIAQISAIGLVAEIGDVGRFAHPRQLMA